MDFRFDGQRPASSVPPEPDTSPASPRASCQLPAVSAHSLNSTLEVSDQSVPTSPSLRAASPPVSEEVEERFGPCSGDPLSDPATETFAGASLCVPLPFLLTAPARADRPGSRLGAAALSHVGYLRGLREGLPGAELHDYADVLPDSYTAKRRD